MKVLRSFFNRDQPALDQGCQCRGGHAEFKQRHRLAQIGHAHPSARSGKLGENGGLVLIEPGDARVRNKYGDSFGASRITLLGEGFASEPFLLHHAVEQSLVGLCRRTHGGGLCGTAVVQVIQHRAFAALILSRQFRSARGGLRCSIEQRHTLVQRALSSLGNAVDEVAVHLGGQRHHAAEHLAQRRNVVLRDPLRKMHQLIGEQRRVVEHLLHGLDRDRVRWPFVMHAHHDSHQPLPTEGHQYARANCRLDAVHRIGEGPVQRHRQRNVTEVGHHI